MPGEPHIFKGEWWWPKWPMSSVLFPPDPKPQDPSIFRDLEAALKLRLKAPFEDPDAYNREAIDLASYAERLWHISKHAVTCEKDFDDPQPMYQFDLLRTYDLNCITHKLRQFQAQLESRPTISYETSQELTKLLQDQGIFYNPQLILHILMEFLKQLPYETLSICQRVLSKCLGVHGIQIYFQRQSYLNARVDTLHSGAEMKHQVVWPVLSSAYSQRTSRLCLRGKRWTVIIISGTFKSRPHYQFGS
jgi:hypothetical protein